MCRIQEEPATCCMNAYLCVPVLDWPRHMTCKVFANVSCSWGVFALCVCIQSTPARPLRDTHSHTLSLALSLCISSLRLFSLTHTRTPEDLPDEGVFAPGDQVRVHVSVRGPSGDPVSAALGVSVTDASVLHLVQPIHAAPRLPVMMLLEDEVCSCYPRGVGFVHTSLLHTLAFSFSLSLSSVPSLSLSLFRTLSSSLSPSLHVYCTLSGCPFSPSSLSHSGRHVGRRGSVTPRSSQ